MATNSNNPSYLPADLRGLPNFASGQRRLYFKQQPDGTKMLVGEIVGNGVVIRYPKGTSVDILTPDGKISEGKVNSQSIEDDSVQMEDLNAEVREKIQKTYDEADETMTMDFDMKKNI
jgi:hypothetical protein